MNLIAHVEIPVADLERAMRFYAAVFEVAFADIVAVHDSRMAAFPFLPGQDGASAALAEGPVYRPSLAGALVYAGVEDLDATLARALAQGAEVLFPKTAFGSAGWVAEIRDSEGNRLGLQQLGAA